MWREESLGPSGVKSLSEAGILEEENHQKKKCKGESDLDYEFLTQKKIDQRMNNRLLIVSLSCLFSKKNTNNTDFTVTFEGSWVCSSAPDVLRILKTSTSYWTGGAAFSFLHGYCITV